MVTSGTEQNVRASQQFQLGPESALSVARARLRERAERNREAFRESDRARFWFACRIAATCVAGCGVGLSLMAWALHTTDVERAKVAWVAGPVIGQAIIIGALVFGAIRWEREDW